MNQQCRLGSSEYRTRAAKYAHGTSFHQPQRKQVGGNQRKARQFIDASETNKCNNKYQNMNDREGLAIIRSVSLFPFLFQSNFRDGQITDY